MDSYYNFSNPSISLGKSDKAFNFFMFIILIVIFFIIIVPWDKLGLNESKEGMSGGTLTQLFAQDAQDVYLKSNVDKIATSDFNLYWNHPTRITQGQNRGTPLTNIYLPKTQMNPTNPTNSKQTDIYESISDNLNEPTYPNPIYKNLSKDDYVLPIDDYIFPIDSELILPVKRKSDLVPTLPKNILPSSVSLKTVSESNPYELVHVLKLSHKSNNNKYPHMTKWKPIDYLTQQYYNDGLYKTNCVKNPNACGNGSGSDDRLNSGYVLPTKAVDYIEMDGEFFYPDSYVGSYYRPPDFDINKPYQFIPDSNQIPNIIKMG